MENIKYYTSLCTFLKRAICYIVFPAPPLQRSLSILRALYPADLICTTYQQVVCTTL